MANDAQQELPASSPQANIPYQDVSESQPQVGRSRFEAGVESERADRVRSSGKGSKGYQVGEDQARSSPVQGFETPRAGSARSRDATIGVLQSLVKNLQDEIRQMKGRRSSQYQHPEEEREG